MVYYFTATQAMPSDKLSFLNVDELELLREYVDLDIHIKANKDNVIVTIM